jgi:hypothetical protein
MTTLQSLTTRQYTFYSPFLRQYVTITYPLFVGKTTITYSSTLGTIKPPDGLKYSANSARVLITYIMNAIGLAVSVKGKAQAMQQSLAELIAVLAAGVQQTSGIVQTRLNKALADAYAAYADSFKTPVPASALGQLLNAIALLL